MSKKGHSMIRKLLVASALVLLLAGCKADIVEVRLDSSDLADAIEGGSPTARFIANFSTFGELDEEQRNQIDSMEDILESNLSIDDFQITAADHKTSVTVEGELPIILGPPGSSGDAFAVYVSPNGD